MNIEEARKHLKKNLNNWKKSKKDNGYMPEIIEEINSDYEAIETLLTAYEKEKEKIKRTIDFIDNKTMTDEEFENIQKIKKYINIHFVPYEQYISKLNELNKKWKDVIKAKIEEIKEEKRHYLEIKDEYNAQICDCIIEEYKSLLEKE